VKSSGEVKPFRIASLHCLEKYVTHSLISGKGWVIKEQCPSNLKFQGSQHAAICKMNL
jgi:hypothetical protein